MLDLRVYRAAFLPALLALFVVAFALTDRPAPATSPLAAEAFDATRAFGNADVRPPRDSLLELARAFPSRRPGSAGDVGLADRVERAFRGAGFQVERRTTKGETVDGGTDLDTVIGVRPGLSDRRIAVLADRDALRAPGLAELSATAALLELARVFRSRDSGTPTATDSRGGRPRALGRDLAKTLVLVSTSGGTGGGAGARAWARSAREDRLDAVIVLGDLASEKPRKPWVIPWSNGRAQPPIGLRRTVEAALRLEVGADPGGARAAGQWMRRAAPFTVGPQGEPAAAGAPALAVSASGERGPAPGAAVSVERLDEFGRGVLRSISAVDAAGPAGARTDAASAESAAPWEGRPQGIVALRNVVPDWSVRLLVGALLLPALLAGLDAVFRARRRHVPVARWVRWLAALALPAVLAWGWLRLLDRLGALDGPPAPVLPGAVPVGVGGAVSLASTALVVVLGAILARRLAARAATLPGPVAGEETAPAAAAAGGAAGAGRFAREKKEPAGAGPAPGRTAAAAQGLAAASGLVLCGLAFALWIANPYAAALVLPAAHGWLLASGRWRGARGGAAIAAGLVLPALALLYYAQALDVGPPGLAWSALLAVAGGHASPGAVLLVVGLAAALAGVVVARRLARRVPAAGRGPGGRRPAPEAVVTRGPLSYAGPGSLGGTESALRR